jgi:hypothetical protein
MRCNRCGEQLKPMIISKKGYIFYAYECNRHHIRKHSEVVRRLLDIHAYTAFKNLNRHGVNITWEQHVRNCIRENNV